MRITTTPTPQQWQRLINLQNRDPKLSTKLETIIYFSRKNILLFLSNMSGAKKLKNKIIRDEIVGENIVLDKQTE